MIKKKLIERIRGVIADDNATAKELALKATEELGELAAALFKHSGYKGSDETNEEIEKNIVEESVDIIICALAVLERKNLLNKEIVDKMFNKKINKWEKVLKKRKERLWKRENMNKF